MANKKINKYSGFTLIEIVIVMAILASVFTAITYFGVDISGFGGYLSDSISVQKELELTLNPIVTEIRSMGPSSIGSYTIESATATSLIFFSDADQDGLFERIRYFLDGSTFKRSVVKPTGNPLVYNLANEKVTEMVHDIVSGSTIIFKYYGKNVASSGTPLSAPIDPLLVRSIKIELTSDRNPKALPGPISYSVFATIRNLRSVQ